MSDAVWYVAVGGKQEGPVSAADVIGRIAGGRLGAGAHVFTQAIGSWVPIGSRAEFAAALSTAPRVPPPPPPSARAHEIDYEILGAEMQFVEITLDPGEACVAEAGAFMYMDPGIEMETIFGDGSVDLHNLFRKRLEFGFSIVGTNGLF